MSISRIDARLMADALLMQMSMPPKCSAHSRTAAVTAASSRTSTTSGSARPPACSISRAAVWIVPGSFGCGSAVLATTAMLAPSRAARSAIASPIPRLAPVMNRVLPDRLIGALPLPPTAGAVYRASWRRPRPLELDAVAVGVLDVERATLALRPVAGGRLAGRDAARGEPGDERRLIERRDRQAEVLEVAPRARWLTGTERPIERDEVDEAAARAQLSEPELGLLTLERAAEQIAIERERALELAHAQYDVVDAVDDEWMIGHRGFSPGTRAPCASIAAPRRGG